MPEFDLPKAPDLIPTRCFGNYLDAVSESPQERDMCAS